MNKEELLSKIEYNNLENIYTSHIIERLFYITIKESMTCEIFNTIFSYYIQYKNILYSDELFQEYFIKNVVEQVDFVAIPDRYLNKDKLLKVIYCKNFIKSLKEEVVNNLKEKSFKAEIIEKLLFLSLVNSNITIYQINNIISLYISYLDLLFPEFNSYFKVKEFNK